MKINKIIVEITPKIRNIITLVSRKNDFFFNKLILARKEIIFISKHFYWLN
jgi:hypothetical protein